MAFVIRTLLDNELLHEDVSTIVGTSLWDYTKEPKLINGTLTYVDGPRKSLNESIIKSVENPFNATGGLKVLHGNLGSAVIKTSAVDESHYVVKAEAVVFDDQDDLIKAYKNDELNKDFIAVIPFQGPKQKGMPELHKLTPTLTILQKKGFNVALVTDGRMSGASGKVPAAIHLTPEAKDGGLIGKIKTGDLLVLNAKTGELNCLVDDLEKRAQRDVSYDTSTHGIALFNNLRNLLSNSTDGASFL